MEKNQVHLPFHPRKHTNTRILAVRQQFIQLYEKMSLFFLSNWYFLTISFLQLFFLLLHEMNIKQERARCSCFDMKKRRLLLTCHIIQWGRFHSHYFFFSNCFDECSVTCVPRQCKPAAYDVIWVFMASIRPEIFFNPNGKKTNKPESDKWKAQWSTKLHVVNNRRNRMNDLLYETALCWILGIEHIHDVNFTYSICESKHPIFLLLLCFYCPMHTQRILYQFKTFPKYVRLEYRCPRIIFIWFLCSLSEQCCSSVNAIEDGKRYVWILHKIFHRFQWIYVFGIIRFFPLKWALREIFHTNIFFLFFYKKLIGFFDFMFV